jgi:hypothetical protein
MSTKNIKAPIKRLTLDRETVKNLNVRTGVQTGVYVVVITGGACIRSAGVAGTNVAGCRSVSASINGEGNG